MIRLIVGLSLMAPLVLVAVSSVVLDELDRHRRQREQR